MSGQQKVSADYIKHVSNEIDDIKQKLTKQVGDLSNMMAQLESDWKGVGGGAYQDAQRRLNDDHRVLHKIIDDIGEAVAATVSASQTNDEDVRAEMRKHAAADLNKVNAISGIDAF
jgi:WXG100 family type VII secretion target